MFALTAWLSGLLFGGLHVLSGPDHLAALAPFSVEARRKAWRLGLRWGIGHSGGVAVVGTLAYLIREQLDLDLLADLGRNAIGGILIAIGIWGLYHLRRMEFAADPAHSNEHHLHSTAAFVVGSVHGVAGTGYLLGVFPLLAMPRWLEAAAYLLGFATGTILAMVLFSTLLGLVTEGAGSRALHAFRWVFGGTSIAALVVGIAWIILPLLGLDLPAG
jgi:hypothetical protein